MILTLAEYRALNPNDKRSDTALGVQLQGLESGIRAYTNNNFQKRFFRFSCSILGGRLFYTTNYLMVGDTVQISDSVFNDGVYNVVEIDSSITLDEALTDEDYALVTKIVYPPDVKVGVANLLAWDNENRGKVGIQSETLSRHSTTYFNMDASNSLMGFPAGLMGFLRPYMKARF